MELINLIKCLECIGWPAAIAFTLLLIWEYRKRK